MHISAIRSFSSRFHTCFADQKDLAAVFPSSLFPEGIAPLFECAPFKPCVPCLAFLNESQSALLSASPGWFRVAHGDHSGVVARGETVLHPRWCGAGAGQQPGWGIYGGYSRRAPAKDACPVGQAPQRAAKPNRAVTCCANAPKFASSTSAVEELCAPLVRSLLPRLPRA